MKNLQAKWAVQLPGDGIVESVPLVVDGIMYTTGPVGGTAQVMALDARTGRQIWRYERKQKVVNPYEINRVNRGVIDPRQPAVFRHPGRARWWRSTRARATFLWENRWPIPCWATASPRRRWW